MKLDPQWKAEIDHCIEVLKNGGLILYPSDTIWGIGCDARNADAVKRIYELKKREDSKSMIVLTHQDIQLHRYVQEVPDVAWDLLEHAVDPITIIYPKGKGVAPNLIAENGSIAIRVVEKGFCNALLFRHRFPVVSTSANLSGHPAPRNFQSIVPAILKGVDYVVNLHTPNEAGKASTIILLQTNGEFKIVRK